MPDRDALGERGRSLEDEYFRKKDRELVLVERIQRAAAAEKVQNDLGRASGLDDPELVQELLDLGFSTETVSLLPIVPILQMVWAEGGISTAERELIVSLAPRRGIQTGSAADDQLMSWMTERPAEAVFGRARRLIRAMLDSESAHMVGLKADDLVQYCEGIASASGGVFGIGRISAEERTLLSSIAADLKSRHA